MAGDSRKVAFARTGDEETMPASTSRIASIYREYSSGSDGFQPATSGVAAGSQLTRPQQDPFDAQS